MRRYHHFEQLPTKQPSAVALGMFDGVHIGHQKVIRAAAEHADTCQVCVLTFTTKQRRPDRKANQKDILPFAERLVQIERCAPVDAVYCPDFEEIRAFTAQQFVGQILHQTLHAAVVCCGDDFRFGSQAKGDVSLLRELCEPLGTSVEIIAPALDSGLPVSSTRIRQLLLEGDLPAANRLLGYHYYIHKEVIYGKQLGRTVLECPTINQALETTNCIPRYGVYASSVLLDGQWYPGVTNIGVKPTVQGSDPLAETHIIGVDQNLYGKQVTVRLHQLIRDERKFDGLEALKKQMHCDIQSALEFFKKQEI